MWELCRQKDSPLDPRKQDALAALATLYLTLFLVSYSTVHSDPLVHCQCPALGRRGWIGCWRRSMGWRSAARSSQRSCGPAPWRPHQQLPHLRALALHADRADCVGGIVEKGRLIIPCEAPGRREEYGNILGGARLPRPCSNSDRRSSLFSSLFDWRLDLLSDGRFVFGETTKQTSRRSVTSFLGGQTIETSIHKK